MVEFRKGLICTVCHVGVYIIYIMDVDRSSLCNCVVNFLLEENYLLTAFELFHELLDDGRDVHAIRLKEFFSDSSQFPPDHISQFNSLRVADPQSLLEEKLSMEEKLALTEYGLRIAQEDILKLKNVILQAESNGPSMDASTSNRCEVHPKKSGAPFFDLGPLRDSERQDLNCAVKEYLLLAGYRLTAMTFYEEVTDHKINVWQEAPSCIPDALRRYYYQYLSSTTEAAEEILQENKSLKKDIDRLNRDREAMLAAKDMEDAEGATLKKTVEALQCALKDKESLVQNLKQTLDLQKIDLNECTAEIISLKMHMQGSRLACDSLANDADHPQSNSLETFQKREIASEMRGSNGTFPVSTSDVDVKAEGVGDTSETFSLPASNITSLYDETSETLSHQHTDSTADKLRVKPADSSESPPCEPGFDTIQILSDALPKIVPFVLINHREELLPLMMCVIERHPDSFTRDSLTHTLFNLIKRPDEQQRKIIMEACVKLAENIGEIRTETELLPQCWEQISHTYEERRLLVAESCGELGGFVRPEIRDSLILSILQQLIEDTATVVREAATHNLALLLLLFPNTDKYSKVEELLFQLVCDPSGPVVEIALKELVPAVVRWGNRLDHILQNLLSHILYSAQHCPPVSGVEGSVESHLRVLGERERWNIDVLLRMLTDLLPFIYERAVDTCPYLTVFEESDAPHLSRGVLEAYARGDMQWDSFDWMHADCFPNLIQLTCFLPQKEDNLRSRIARFLLMVSERFGEEYLSNIMFPLFLVAVGDNADLTFFPQRIKKQIRGVRPRNSSVGEEVAVMGVLPLILGGVLGGSSDRLKEFLNSILLRPMDRRPARHRAEIFNAVRFLCTFEEHHAAVFSVAWDMVVHPDADVRADSSRLLKAVVPSVDVRTAQAHVLPALITLGSDDDPRVKCTSIDALGSVAQNFKNDAVVEKIRVQMDAFVEDGSHDATVAVVRALAVAVPNSTEKLREYLLSRIFGFTSMPVPADDIMQRQERANAFCEAIRALDAIDLPSSSVRDFLLPTIQNLMKDADALDPAHKEALEIIMRERSAAEGLGRAGGGHLSLPSSVTSFFSGGAGEQHAAAATPPPAAQDTTRFRRIISAGFTDMLKRQA